MLIIDVAHLHHNPNLMKIHDTGNFPHGTGTFMQHIDYLCCFGGMTIFFSGSVPFWDILQSENNTPVTNDPYNVSIQEL
jgi:hypothetical protein